MKSLLLFSATLLVGLSSFARDTPVFRPGVWEMEEVLHIPLEGDEILSWDYSFLVDGAGKIIGVGEEMDGAETSQDVLSMMILEANGDRSCSGFVIEAYEDGEIFQMTVNGEIQENGEALVLTAQDGNGRVVATGHARWQADEGEASFPEGSWMVQEIVSPDRGGWNIAWESYFSSRGGTLVGKGNKVRVNGRPAYPGEQKTEARVTLQPTGEKSTVRGTSRETNHRGGVIDAEYEGWISPSKSWFLVESYEKGELAGLLYGRAQ